VRTVKIRKSSNQHVESWDLEDPAFRNVVGEHAMSSREEDEFLAVYGSRALRKAAKERLKAREQARKSRPAG
jgi:hypothetical protein